MEVIVTLTADGVAVGGAVAAALKKRSRFLKTTSVKNARTTIEYKTMRPTVSPSIAAFVDILEEASDTEGGPVGGLEGGGPEGGPGGGSEGDSGKQRHLYPMNPQAPVESVFGLK